MPRVSLDTSYGTEVAITTWEEESHATLSLYSHGLSVSVVLSMDELAGLRANITHALEEVKA